MYIGGCMSLPNIFHLRITYYSYLSQYYVNVFCLEFWFVHIELRRNIFNLNRYLFLQLHFVQKQLCGNNFSTSGKSLSQLFCTQLCMKQFTQTLGTEVSCIFLLLLLVYANVSTYSLYLSSVVATTFPYFERQLSQRYVP